MGLLYICDTCWKALPTVGDSLIGLSGYFLEMPSQTYPEGGLSARVIRGLV